MKQQQRKVIIAAMLTAIFFLSSTTLWFYIKESSVKKSIQPTLSVLVAKHFIKTGTKIKPDDIAVKQFPKDLISFKPVSYTEAVGQYATKDILKFMPVEKQEISLIKPKTKNPKQSQYIFAL